MSAPPRRIAPFALLLAAGLGLACGEEGRRTTYAVTGKVTHKGQPLANAAVTFLPTEQAADVDTFRPSGTTDDQGNFALTTYEQGDGAPAGSYKVTVAWSDPKTTPPPRRDGPEADAFQPTPSPAQRKNPLAKYAAADTSGLTAEVKESATEANFDLP